MRFLWDPIKAKTNIKKHGVSFEEAVSVFLDPEALRIYDEQHSVEEVRWILLGLSNSLRLLVVVHAEKDDEAIRIISARKADKKETQTYIRRRQ
ncbi:MAG: BrnT family toxin [Pseudobdellovibrionaceae bacterium]